MPHRSVLVPLLAAIALAACDGDDNGGGTRPEPEQRAVVLRLDRDSPRPGEMLTLTVENRTRDRLGYGLAYRLERFVDGEWRWINRDAAFALILKGVEAGKRESEQIRLPDDAHPGRHRIVKEFTAPAAGREYRAAVKFEVASL